MANMDRAVTTLICGHPFFATVLFHLDRHVDNSQPTAWTDGKRLGYNQAFVDGMSDPELVGLLAHEILHVTGLHPWRQQGRELERWNIACDAVINDVLKECNFQLPAGGVPGIADTTPEALYAKMPPSMEQQGGGFGQVRPAGGSAAEQQQGMQEARILTRQALASAKAQGKLPAGLSRLCDEALESKVPWREVLSQYLDSFAKTDYSWSRPNLRYAGSGFILPSLWSPAYGSIVIGADTSGSVGNEELRSVGSEIMGALACYAETGQVPKATVAWFDHAVYPQEMTDVDAMCDLRPKGGGGTSFRVVFEWIAQQEEQPRCCIMITDGYSDDFGPTPDIPVLWVLTQPNSRFTPPFGTTTCVL